MKPGPIRFTCRFIARSAIEMKDPRMSMEGLQMPFDMNRFSMGGFEVALSARQAAAVRKRIAKGPRVPVMAQSARELVRSHLSL